MGVPKGELRLTLPDWVAVKTMAFVVAGNEIVARYKFGYWEIKTIRCNRCGNCCRNVGQDWFAYDPATGHCKYLKLEHVIDGEEVWRCADPDQPWHCVRGSGEGMGINCCINYERA